MRTINYLLALLFLSFYTQSYGQESFLKFLNFNDTLQYEFLDLELDEERNELHVMLEVGNGSTGFIYLYKMASDGNILDSMIIEPEDGFFSINNQSRLLIQNDTLYYAGDYLGSDQAQFLLSIPIDYSDFKLSLILEDGDFIFNRALSILINDSFKYLISNKQKPNFRGVTSIKKLDQNNQTIWEKFIEPPTGQDSWFKSAFFDEGLLVVGQNINSGSFSSGIVNNEVYYYSIDNLGNVTEYLQINNEEHEYVSSNIIKLGNEMESEYVAGFREYLIDESLAYPALPILGVVDNDGCLKRRIILGDQNYYFNGIEEIDQSIHGLTMTGQKFVETPVRKIKPIVCRMTSELDTAWCMEYFLDPDALDIEDRVTISGLDVFADGSIVIGGDYFSTADSRERPFIMKIVPDGCYLDQCPEVSSVVEIIDQKYTTLTVSPNPASEQITFQAEKDYKLQIYSMDGKQIITLELKSEEDFVLDISLWSDGMYFYKDESNKVSGRFMKIR